MDNRGSAQHIAQALLKMLELYDIGASTENQIEQVTRHVWKINTSKGTFGIKAVPFNSSRLEYLYQVNQHLIQMDFPGVAKMLATVQGLPYWEDDQGRCYYAYEWIEGQKYNLNSKKSQLRGMTKLAELHKAAVGFFPKGIEIPDRWGQWPEKFRDRAMEINGWLQKEPPLEDEDEAWREVYEHGSYFAEQALMATEMISSPEYQQVTEQEQALGTFCHRDYAPRNLLVGANQQLHILDFDYSICDIRLYDLTRFLQIVVSEQNWDWEVGRGLLTEYHRVRPLAPAEQCILAANLWFPRKFWLYGKHLRHQSEYTVRDGLARNLRTALLEEGRRVAFINQLQKWKMA